MNQEIEQKAPATKYCMKCGLEKLLIEFNKNKANSDGLRSCCRPCSAEYLRAYYEANKGKLSAQHKIYREANKEAISAWMKDWYNTNKKTVLARAKGYRETNKEAILVRKRIYREANKEAISGQRKVWYEVNKKTLRVKHQDYRKANKEAIRLKIKAWCEQNREQYIKLRRLRATRRRARKRGAIVVPLTPAMEQAKYQEQNGRCYYRNEELNGIYHIEHKIPFCRGGNDIPENIVLACRRCNLEKGRMTDVEFFELIRTESVEEVA